MEMQKSRKEGKGQLRKQISSLRAQLDPESEKTMNQAIFKRIIAMPCFQNPEAVYLYVDCRHEAGTRGLIEYFLSRKVAVAVPRVLGKSMDFYYIRSMDDLEKGGFGILEPKNSCVLAEQKRAPVIVPGVAFTRDGKRLGYGGGYYDRFFEREPQHLKVAIAFDFQIVEEMETDSYDIPIDYVVTPDFQTA